MVQTVKSKYVCKIYVQLGVLLLFWQDALIPLYKKETDDKTRLQNSLLKVANLIDAYLAEIAPDTNLKVDKFVALSEVLPDHARAQDDGLYRAIDIFLKVLLLDSFLFTNL